MIEYCECKDEPAWAVGGRCISCNKPPHKQDDLIDKIIEIFSTHPNIIKRLNAIQKISK